MTNDRHHGTVEPLFKAPSLKKKSSKSGLKRGTVRSTFTWTYQGKVSEKVILKWAVSHQRFHCNTSHSGIEDNTVKRKMEGCGSCSNFQPWLALIRAGGAMLAQWDDWDQITNLPPLHWCLWWCCFKNLVNSKGAHISGLVNTGAIKTVIMVCSPVKQSQSVLDRDWFNKSSWKSSHARKKPQLAGNVVGDDSSILGVSTKDLVSACTSFVRYEVLHEREWDTLNQNTEHYWSDMGAVLYLFQTVAYQCRSHVAYCGPLAAGQQCRMDPGCSWA